MAKTQNPAASNQKPAAINQASRIEDPGSRIEYPATSSQPPVTSHQSPAARTQQPATSAQQPVLILLYNPNRLLQRLIQLLGLGAAGLGHIRSAATAAADDGSDLFDNLAGMIAIG